jgi:branched-chain amino acid transport system permease protein
MSSTFRKERIDRPIKARSDDIFALGSYREIGFLLAPRVVPVILLLILPVALYFGVSPLWTKVLTSAAIIAILALSWDLMYSTGMISLGQSFFFGIGAYFAGTLNHFFGLPPLVTIPVAALLGGLLSTAILIPVLRLRGIYFAMVTMALSFMLVRIIEATGIFGGTQGISGLTPMPHILFEAYLALAVMLACLFGFRRLIDSDFGLVLKGIGENDRAVMRAGINIYWYKAQTLFIATAVVAFAGAFMVHSNQVVGLASFALDYSILPVAAVVVGGPGTFAGAVVGAYILVPLSESLRAIGTLRIIFYGLMMVIFVFAIPEGVFHFLQRRYHQLERKVTVEIGS